MVLGVCEPRYPPAKALLDPTVGKNTSDNSQVIRNTQIAAANILPALAASDGGRNQFSDEPSNHKEWTAATY